MTVTPCGNIAKDTDCNARPSCVWNKVDASNERGASCADIDCTKYTKDTTCKDASVNKFCSWDATKKTCAKKVTPPVVCSTITDGTTCPKTIGASGKCVW